VRDAPHGAGGVRESLDAYGVRPSKRLGQNFLVDENVVAAILEAIGSDAGADVVEIGPGLGALTTHLAQRARRLAAVEIDRRLAARLRETLSGAASGVEVCVGDILDYDFAGTAAAWGERLVVVGSVPYSITSPILKKLIDGRAAIRAAHLITQREVAEKIQASPGPHGTALGTFVRAYADVSIVRRVPRGAFYPVPDVDSCLWKLETLDAPRFRADEALFFAVVRAIYGARRKTLRNALERGFPRPAVAAMLARARQDGAIRGETLGFPELDALALAARELNLSSAGGESVPARGEVRGPGDWPE
jgi:16S rRNA (adenine1518-N6/adenine1519-N6)-dimethyltransferase